MNAMKWYEEILPYHVLIPPDIRDAPTAAELSTQEIERRARMCQNNPYKWDLLIDRLYPPPRMRDYYTARQCREDQRRRQEYALTALHASKPVRL